MDNNNRLYVGNLSFDADEGAIRTAFAAFGEVQEIKVITDRDTGRPRGFAFVTMADGEGAKKAIASLNGTMLLGRELRVNVAEDRRPNNDRGGSGGRSRERSSRY